MPKVVFKKVDVALSKMICVLGRVLEKGDEGVIKVKMLISLRSYHIIYNPVLAEGPRNQ